MNTTSRPVISRAGSERYAASFEAEDTLNDLPGIPGAELTGPPRSSRPGSCATAELSPALRLQEHSRKLGSRFPSGLGECPALLRPEGCAPRPTRSVYVHLEHCSGGEAFAMGLVVAAVAMAITDSLFCGLDLVQNWELFGNGIRNLIQ